MSQELIKNAFSKGLTFEDFLKKTDEYVNGTDTTSLTEEEKFYYDYTKLNLQRMKRVMKTHAVPGEVADKLNRVTGRQYWMIITENWCGDSAQSSPEFYKMSLLNENIELKVVERDTFPEVMDLYLTNGKKSIPIVVAFDSDWNQLWKWGARPAALQTQMDEWVATGAPKEEWIEKIHLWYGKNRGEELYKEVNSLL